MAGRNNSACRPTQAAVNTHPFTLDLEKHKGKADLDTKTGQSDSVGDYQALNKNSYN